MCETREPYQTFASSPCEPLFMVELIDTKGASHGYIGYRFHAPGAQGAADSWNNNRDRGDLVAVVKPVDQPTVVQATDEHDSIQLDQIRDMLGFGPIAKREAITGRIRMAIHCLETISVIVGMDGDRRDLASIVDRVRSRTLTAVEAVVAVERCLHLMRQIKYEPSTPWSDAIERAQAAVDQLK